MIDMTKQYTYEGKPVRIYADGSDCSLGMPHGAVLCDDGRWYNRAFLESDLVEVWEPKDRELVWCWVDDDTLPSLRRYDPHRVIWRNYAKFTGTLPEAFKGL